MIELAIGNLNELSLVDVELLIKGTASLSSTSPEPMSHNQKQLETEFVQVQARLGLGELSE